LHPFARVGQAIDLGDEPVRALGQSERARCPPRHLGEFDGTGNAGLDEVKPGQHSLE
jgi:hypothetical protein